MSHFKKYQLAIILFAIALLVRILLLLLFDNNKIHPDSHEYHTLAVNIVKSNGMSMEQQEPYEKSYFREPGYPYFLSGIYYVVNVFHSVEYITDYNITTYQLTKTYPEIVSAKITQIILDSISVAIFFYFLTTIVGWKIAFITSVLIALFVNLAFHSTYILRESITFFLLILLNFFYLKLFFTNKTWLLNISVGLTIGFLILIFQVHLLLLPAFFLLLWIKTKSFKKSVVNSFLVGVISLIVVSPHLIKVYKFYPDLRIIKSLGSSFTHEQLAYDRAYDKAEFYGLLTPDERKSKRDWGNQSKVQFDRSFNGFYIQKADSINNLLPEPYFSKRKISNVITNFKKSFFLTKLGYRSGKDLVQKSTWTIIPLIIIPVSFGLLGILGTFAFGRKYLIYFIPFLVYILLFNILGNTYRRMIILQPYLIFFSVLLISEIYKFYLQRFRVPRE